MTLRKNVQEWTSSYVTIWMKINLEWMMWELQKRRNGVPREEWGWPPATRRFAACCFFSSERRHSFAADSNTVLRGRWRWMRLSEWGWPHATGCFATCCFFSISRRHYSPDRRCKSPGEDWTAPAPGSWKPVIIRDLVMRVAWGRVACRSASPTISASCSCGPDSRGYHHLRPDLLQRGHVILRFLAKVKHLSSRLKFK